MRMIMYTKVKLSNKILNEMRTLNKNRLNFNNTNLEFFKIYEQCDFINKFFMRRNVTLLALNDLYIGYIWLEKNSKSHYIINALNILEEKDNLGAFNQLVGSLKKNNSYTFNCEQNSINSSILKQLDFISTEETFELVKDLNDFHYNTGFNNDNLNSDITFEVVNKGSNEKIRTKIQNQVFKNVDRIPLTVQDIYYDEMQSYYYDKGSVFLKKDNLYIGYGQIIIENQIPTIVNFGILNEFRRMGYGKMFLDYLSNILKTNSFKTVYLKVNKANIPALNLYTNNGFKLYKHFIKWELKK